MFVCCFFTSTVRRRRTKHIQISSTIVSHTRARVPIHNVTTVFKRRRVTRGKRVSVVYILHTHTHRHQIRRRRARVYDCTRRLFYVMYYTFIIFMITCCGGKMARFNLRTMDMCRARRSRVLHHHLIPGDRPTENAHRIILAFFVNYSRRAAVAR